MHALNKWIDNHTELLAHTGAFIMTFLLMLAMAGAACANNVAPPVFTQNVLVLSRDTLGEWHARVGTIKLRSNMFVTACFELPQRVTVECFFVHRLDTDVDLEEMELIGEKKT